MGEATTPALASGRLRVMVVTFLGVLFAGLSMSMHLLFVRPAILDLLGSSAANSTALEVAVGQWMAWFTCALLLGMATGGAVFGWLGDRFGRVVGVTGSILCYTLVGSLGYFARSPEELLAVRFLSSLGIGGMWPNGVALVAEFWSDLSRPLLAGLIGMATNLGFVLLGLVALQVKITPESWRWLFLAAATPAVLGLVALAVLPESPRWLMKQTQDVTAPPPTPFRELLSPGLRYATLIGVLLGAIPIIGNWGGNNWIIPWSDQVAGRADPARKALMQITRSGGAVFGSLLGGWVASRFGRRSTYFGISLACLVVSGMIYRFLTPLDPAFPYWVFALGVVGVAYFGWLPLYLPELFPTRVRATGTGVAFNFGRILAVPCVLGAGAVHAAFGGDYARVGQITSLVYLFGMVVACLAPDTSKQPLKD